MQKSKISINTGLKLVIWAIPACLTIRLIQMNFFFDYDTGFYTDGGLTAWLSVLAPVLMSCIAAFAFSKNARAFTAVARTPSKGAGIFAGFSGGVLLVLGCFMLKDYVNLGKMMPTSFETTRNAGLHVALAVLSLVFGALQCLMAASLCAGIDPFKKAPLLYLPGPAWGAVLLVAVYVFYAKSSSTVENLYTMLGTALLLAALFYLCRTLAGVGEPAALRMLFMTGGMASALVIPYDLSNVALAMMGKTYFGEMPGIYSLGRLTVAVFILAFMLSAYRTGVDKELDGVPAEPKHAQG